MEAPETIWEYERVGCMWALIRGSYNAYPSFFSMGVRETERGSYIEEYRYVSPLMEEWEEDFTAIYFPCH